MWAFPSRVRAMPDQPREKLLDVTSLRFSEVGGRGGVVSLENVLWQGGAGLSLLQEGVQPCHAPVEAAC